MCRASGQDANEVTHPVFVSLYLVASTPYMTHVEHTYHLVLADAEENPGMHPETRVALEQTPLPETPSADILHVAIAWLGEELESIQVLPPQEAQAEADIDIGNTQHATVSFPRNDWCVLEIETRARIATIGQMEE